MSRLDEMRRLVRMNPNRLTPTRVVALASLISMQWGWVGGCAATGSVRATDSAPEEQTPAPREQLIPEAFHYYTTGNFMSSAGNDSAAVVQYRRALTYDPGSRHIRLSLARSYARLGRYEEAAITAESVRPRDPEVLELLAELYVRMRNYSRRLSVYEEWAALDSNNVAVWQFLANTYRSSNDTTGQLRALTRLAVLQPEPVVYEQMGFLELATGDVASAEQWFQKVVTVDSSQRATRVYLGLAQIWSDRDQADSAFTYYHRAVELNYYNTELRKRFFFFLLQQNRREEALEQGRIILGLASQEPDVLYRVAVLEFDAGEVDSAEVHLTRWIADYGDDGLGRFLLGRMAMEKGDTATAEAQFVQSMLLADSLVEPYLSLAFLYSRAQLHDSAQAIYRLGLTRLPDHPDLLFGYGASLEQQGEYDLAVTQFEHLLANEPDHAPALNYLGYMWADRGVRLAEALQLIGRAVELQPDNGAYLDSYAWVLYRLGRLRDAEEKLQEALNYIQDDAVVFEHYGDILADLGRRDEARSKWQRALELDPDNEELKSKLGR
jgi:tetratricopeptide (TPR) repeat protein